MSNGKKTNPECVVAKNILKISINTFKVKTKNCSSLSLNTVKML